jgi:predicted glycosyltransferase
MDADCLTYSRTFFENPQHACHVQMSMIKLLQRVVTPEDIDEEGEQSTQDGYTYGTIASDPLTQFSVVFAALIHDGE